MKTITDYETTIKNLHRELSTIPEFHPAYEAHEKKIATQVKAWAKLVNVVVFAAKNEQTPWLESELDIPVKPMKLKSESGFGQTGDYSFTVNGIFASLVIERKGVTRKNGRMIGCDLYSTMFKKEKRERFTKEFARFKADPRLDTFKVVVECSYGEYLSFTPLFNGKQRNVNHIGASVASRVGTIASLEESGCHIIWAGTRERAVELYRSMVRMWVISHYQSIINLEG